MRTILIAIIALLATWPLPSHAATRNFGVNGFDRIRVDGPFKVSLRTGVAPFASAWGSPAALDRVAVEVQGRTLIVRSSQSSWGGYPGADAGPVEIRVGTHELSAAWLNGAGVLKIDHVEGLLFDLSVQGSGVIEIADANVDQLKVGVGGTGSAALAGRAGKMTVLVRGLSSLDASRLITKDAAIGAEGPATIAATVTNAATVEGTGVGTVALSGNPSCTVRLRGSATVSGCKSTQ